MRFELVGEARVEPRDRTATPSVKIELELGGKAEQLQGGGQVDRHGPARELRSTRNARMDECTEVPCPV